LLQRRQESNGKKNKSGNGQIRFPEQIVEAAIEEDADIVGLSTLGGNHLTLGTKVVRLLREKGLENITVFMGGVMPPKDAVTLEQEHGIAKVFLPDTPMQTIIDTINAKMNLKASA
jgi:methylmalonyl-CoA mutase C-terminal domain/subunit